MRDGHPRDIMVDGKYLRSVGLDLPPMTQLAQEIHRKWPDFRINLLSVDEFIQEFILHLRYQPNQSHNNNENTVSQENVITQVSPYETSDVTNSLVDNYIEAKNLWYSYLRGTPLETEALRGLDFQVANGGIIGVAGATGSGKSTLLQHLNGILTPQAGTLRVGVMQITNLTKDLRSVRQQVALLFQQPEDQLFEMYLADDIAYGPLNLGLSLDEVRQRVSSAMQAVGLPMDEFRDRSIYSLSGGERRRAALAGVLALEPKVLVLDEATAGLDPRGRSELTGFLKDWHTGGERSIVWASHSMDEISQIAKRVTVLSGGRVVQEDSPMQVFRMNGKLPEYGLDIPQIMQVIGRLTKMGYVIDDKFSSITDVIPILQSLLN